MVSLAASAVSELASPPLVPPEPECALHETPEFRVVLEQNYTGIWRLLRRLGVPENQSEDAAQEVFWIAARRWADVRAGSERSFLYGTALRVAADARRARDARREVPDSEAIERTLSTIPDPEEMLNRRRARAVLDLVL